jgi:hypothetical protein
MISGSNFDYRFTIQGKAREKMYRGWNNLYFSLQLNLFYSFSDFDKADNEHQWLIVARYRSFARDRIISPLKDVC